MFGNKRRNVDAVEIITEAGENPVETDLKKCCHCGGFWRKRPGSGIQRGFCFKCMDDFCGPGCMECKPHEQQLLDEAKLLNSIITGG